METSQSSGGLRWFSKLLCAAVLFLIFVGALVTSHDAGLSVPDWPTTYGQNMFLFPPRLWLGGIFFEHSHRLIASGIGLLTVILTIWTWRVEPRRWVRVLTYCALAAVILQGTLGGLTVLYKLPDAISISHALLGQTFLVITIIIAYAHSKEFYTRTPLRSPAFRIALYATGAVYLQLFLGALMRHTQSGLAVPDFPTVGGEWLPRFDAEMFSRINALRHELVLNPASPAMVAFHLLHRFWAVVVTGLIFYTDWMFRSGDEKLQRTTRAMSLLVALQFCLGVYTVLSTRQPYITSIHVVAGALLLGFCVLLCLRSAGLASQK